jgi:hypothetical protein
MCLLDTLNKELDEKRTHFENKKNKCTLSMALFEKSILNTISKHKDETHFNFPIQDGCGSHIREFFRKNKVEPWVPGSIHSVKILVISFHIE